MGKKFPFFDEENDDSPANPLLNNITPMQMHAFNQTLFISCKNRKKINHSYLTEPMIIKMSKNTIIDEYKPFNKMIHNFQFISIEGSHYFVICGMDFDKFKTATGTEEFVFMTSIKIYDAGVLLTKKVENYNIQPYLVRQINLMRNIKDTSKYSLGKSVPEGYESIQNIISFALSPNADKCALGLDLGQIILISGTPSIIETSEKNLKVRCLNKFETDLHVTNLAFSQFENCTILYATTTQELFFYKLFEREPEQLFQLTEETGAYSGCIDVKGDKLLIATSLDTQILEYYNLEMGPSNFFEGKKQFCCYFKSYILFIVIDDTNTMFAIYDKINKFFCYHSQSFTKVSAVCTDSENIYAFVEVNYSSKKIIKLIEKDNKYKFEIFYKRSFFDTALEYAKNLNFDKKKIAEIHQRHGDHIFQKGDYQKAIEQYILTINYLDPSIVIQRFLDGSKLDYLILYLEALHKENNFAFRSANEMKDYTALLLNCYIKQKQIEKLKEFVDGKDISPQLINVETAIEVCKDTNQIDLALSIADKARLFENFISLLIDYKSKI